MEIAMLVIGIILLVFAVFLIVAVLMQQGKAHNLSGAIAGGAETFFGKTKGQTINKKLSVITTIVAIVFVLLVSSVYVMQDGGKSLDDYDSFWDVINPFSEDVIEDTHGDHDDDEGDKGETDKGSDGADSGEADKGSDSADSGEADKGSDSADSGEADKGDAGKDAE